MKYSKHITIVLIVFIIGFGIWLEENPPYSNDYPADITIIKKYDTLYELKNVPEGGFKYYRKKDPEEIIFSAEGKDITIYNHNNDYQIEIIYHGNPKVVKRTMYSKHSGYGPVEQIQLKKPLTN